MEFLRRLTIELPARVFLVVASLAAVLILICIFYAIRVAPCTTTIFGLEFGPQRPCSSMPSLPSKTILPYYGSRKDIPDGWSICGKDEPPDLNERFLIGTNEPSEIGMPVGSVTHIHSFTATSNREGTPQPIQPRQHEGVDNGRGTNTYHQHEVIGETMEKKHIPPSVKVLFLCKE